MSPDIPNHSEFRVDLVANNLSHYGSRHTIPTPDTYYSPVSPCYYILPTTYYLQEVLIWVFAYDVGIRFEWSSDRVSEETYFRLAHTR